MREILQEDSDFERHRDRLARMRKQLFARWASRSRSIDSKDIPEGETITLYRDGNSPICVAVPTSSVVSDRGRQATRDLRCVPSGDESSEMLQRIYGTAFAKPEELETYLEQVELAKKRDHRRLGQELDLFSFNEHAPASPFFHPQGRRALQLPRGDRAGVQLEDGFDEVITPQILDVDLWHTSGHYENYREAMFFAELPTSVSSRSSR